VLSLACPNRIDELADGVAVYVALELPPIWEAAVLMIGSIVDQEFNSRMAILHPPHITLHPPFFPIVGFTEIIDRIRALAGELIPEPIKVSGVESFDDENGVPTQMVLMVERDWCLKTHSLLSTSLSDCWNHTDPLTMQLWPSAHRLEGYKPHVSLAIGDLPAEPRDRKSLKLRITELMDHLFRLGNAPLSFLPRRLSVIGYRHLWQSNRYQLEAGPNLLAVIDLPGRAAK
jgi:hypothetical protein